MSESHKLEPGKIFVGGLSWDTTKESLVQYFSTYGDVTDGVIMVDSVSKMPRGFGFVTFGDISSVTAVMDEENHLLDGKKIDPKEAITKDHHATSQLGKNSSIEKKVFVGGLPHGCTHPEVKSYFEKYGKVFEVDMKMDRATSKPRGFAFVEYESAESAADAVRKQFQMFKDKKVEVKQAENRIPSNIHTTNSYTTPQFGPGYPQTQATPPGNYGYTAPYYSYQANYPTAYQQPQSSYAPSHSNPQPSGYASQNSGYQTNGYQHNYPNPSYPSQSFTSSAYNQGYSTPSHYPQGYSSGYAAPSEPTQSQGYGQNQSGANYYQASTYPQSGYQSDTRYPQPSQRNW